MSTPRAESTHGWTPAKGQATALQQFAIAAAERRRAEAAVRTAEQQMRVAQKEVTRLGNVKLPVTTELLSGEVVTIDHPTEHGPDSFFRVTFSRRLDLGEPS